MSKLDELKKRSDAKRAERENIYRQAVGQAMQRVMKDAEGIITLNALSQQGAAVFKDNSVADKFVTQMTEEVTKSITNPVDNLMLLCKNRGFTERRTRVVVNKVYEMFFMEFSKDGITDVDSVEYEDKLQAVATKLELEQNLWEDLPILQRVGE